MMKLLLGNESVVLVPQRRYKIRQEWAAITRYFLLRLGQCLKWLSRISPGADWHTDDPPQPTAGGHWLPPFRLASMVDPSTAKDLFSPEVASCGHWVRLWGGCCEFSLDFSNFSRIKEPQEGICNGLQHPLIFWPVSVTQLCVCVYTSKHACVCVHACKKGRGEERKTRREKAGESLSASLIA